MSSAAANIGGEELPQPQAAKPAHSARWIAVGLLLGVVCGVMFGEYCRPLRWVGNGYVSLLQMTVLPYLTVSLIAKMGRLEVSQARKLGLVSLFILILLWLIGIGLVVAVAAVLPPFEGASVYSPERALESGDDWLSRFGSANLFRWLNDEFVPGVVVFCLLFGAALIPLRGKERLLDLLDLCASGIGRINALMIRLAPIGLFTLTADAAGALRLDEISRLQAYLIMLMLACVVGAFAVLPLLLSGLTTIRARELLRAAQEPVLTAIATGKLFVVLPQILSECERLAEKESGPPRDGAESTVSVVVPLAYSFPHLGKILTLVFISFAAWYAGRALSFADTAGMAATGAISSFASPLITMPFLLDLYRIPQDLMSFFILPGFITMRMGDVVGVLHLMVFSLIANQAMQGRLRIRWRRLALGGLAIMLLLFVAGGLCRIYLASTGASYDLDQRLLSLEIPSPHDDVAVYKSQSAIPDRPAFEGGALERVKAHEALRVGYHPDRLPYTYFNNKGRLVGLDVELVHRLAERLEVRLEFVPYTRETVQMQLESGEIDIALGGLMITPQRLLHIGFTRPYQSATIAVVLPDHRRDEIKAWDDANRDGIRLAVVYKDLANAAQRILPDAEIVVAESCQSFFEGKVEADGLIITAEEGAAWNALYPEFAVVVPRPVIRRPVGVAMRANDATWFRFLDHWLDFERSDGDLDRLHTYWIAGGGTQKRPPRWCIARDVLHWLP